jgi:hypothetical protein
MGEQLSKLELKAIATYLRKVYPGVAQQDELWNLITKVEQLSRGNNARPNRRRGDSSQSA